MEHGQIFTVELTITRRTALIAWSPNLLSCHLVASSAAVEQKSEVPSMSNNVCFTCGVVKISVVK